MPTTLTSMVSAAIVSSIVESTSRQLEGIFGELEGTSVGVEIVSIKQDPPHQRRGDCMGWLVPSDTSPRDNRHEPT